MFHSKTTSEPGITFARFAKVKAVSHLEHTDAIKVAERMYGADSDVFGIVKANEVVAGSNVSGNWASDLTGLEGSGFADFAAYLRPATILGKFGQGSVPSLRKVPFREPLISQTAGGNSYWVGEGKPAPLTAFDFERVTIAPLKIGNIAVLTKENIKSSNPASDIIVRDALRDALAAGLDTSFIDPANAGTANVKPASVTNGSATVVSTGTEADHIRLDIRALFQKFITASNTPSTGVFIMSSTNALALSLMVNALGQKEFPGMTMKGGVLEGLACIVSDYAGDIVALVNASDIYEADEGETTVDISMESSLEMKSAALSQDATSGTGTSLVSLWQNGLVGLKGERTINWKKRRASAVAYLTGVAWGGTVPNS
ncbi:phage major capsid protein [Hyphomicrobium sp. B1]|uniref:phage major capsid protein n=1 Tax=Hyphomicrobium sp. B1 TaxID=3075651 RepID=UPI003C2EDC1C